MNSLPQGLWPLLLLARGSGAGQAVKKQVLPEVAHVLGPLLPPKGPKSPVVSLSSAPAFSDPRSGHPDAPRRRVKARDGCKADGPAPRETQGEGSVASDPSALLLAGPARAGFQSLLRTLG